jgi:hypothetical protein
MKNQTEIKSQAGSAPCQQTQPPKVFAPAMTAQEQFIETPSKNSDGCYPISAQTGKAEK